MLGLIVGHGAAGRLSCKSVEVAHKHWVFCSRRRRRAGSAAAAYRGRWHFQPVVVGWLPRQQPEARRESESPILDHERLPASPLGFVGHDVSSPDLMNALDLVI